MFTTLHVVLSEPEHAKPEYLLSALLTQDGHVNGQDPSPPAKAARDPSAPPERASNWKRPPAMQGMLKRKFLRSLGETDGRR